MSIPQHQPGSPDFEDRWDSFVDLLDSKEAADALNTKASTLAAWRFRGEPRLPFVKLGSKVLYRRSDVLAFLESNYRADGREAVESGDGHGKP
jgi:excisionase family DNA binding protein